LPERERGDFYEEAIRTYANAAFNHQPRPRFGLHIIWEVEYFMDRKIRRGDMIYADLPPGVGSEQSGYRPVVVISNNTGNKHSQTIIAAIITSRTAGKPKMPTHCSVRAQQGLGRDSLVLLEQIRTIDRARVKEDLGTLDGDTLTGIDKALAVSVGLFILPAEG
jgi:mRNA interferase MazF